jgi:hypothetical protein
MHEANMQSPIAMPGRGSNALERSSSPVERHGLIAKRVDSSTVAKIKSSIMPEL